MNHKKTHVLKSLAVCLPTASLADVWSERQSTVLKFDSSWSQNVVSEKASGVATAFTLSFTPQVPLSSPLPTTFPPSLPLHCLSSLWSLNLPPLVFVIFI